MEPINSTSPKPPGLIKELFRVHIYRISLGSNHLFSRVFIAVYNFFASFCTFLARTFAIFDNKDSDAIRTSLENMGAEVHWIKPRDNKGFIQMLTFKAEDLDNLIREKGGTWEKMTLNDGRTVFAIIPPAIEHPAWKEFEKNFSVFEWKKEEGVIITSECPEVTENRPTQCFLFTHAVSHSYALERKRIGLYIGQKQDVCFYDNGNTWKNENRPVSERSFYLEIEAVHKKLKKLYGKSYDTTRLWVGGFCFGVPTAAYLKRTLHEEGVNFFSEQSFLELDDFLKPPFQFLKPLMAYYKGSLHNYNEDIENAPPQTDFSPAKMWADLPSYTRSVGGKFILIQVDNDNRLPSEMYTPYMEIAKKISRKAYHIIYHSNRPINPHVDVFYKYKDTTRQFFQAVFDDTDLLPNVSFNCNEVPFIV